MLSEAECRERIKDFRMWLGILLEELPCTDLAVRRAYQLADELETRLKPQVTDAMIRAAARGDRDWHDNPTIIFNPEDGSPWRDYDARMRSIIAAALEVQGE